jgi:hypothetical protein
LTWYFSDLARFQAERGGLEIFAVANDWFVPVRWHIDDSIRLVLDADIVAGGRVYPIFLQYPDLYPHTPPSVFPRGDTSRWSGHQYGAGGELCLEHGPDNWTPELTGVHLIKSAHRLLEGENPISGETGTVPSRHIESLGQALRSQYARLLLTRESHMFLSTIPVGVPLTGTLIVASHKESAVSVISKGTRPDGSTWIDQSVPTQLAEEFFERPVIIFRVEPGASLPPTANLKEFREGYISLGLSLQEVHTVVLQGDTVNCYFLWEKDNSVRGISVVPAQSEAVRVDSSREMLKERHVALIGCGSLGSKLGAMLARAGVGHFLLIDDDILLPDNLVRNELDWRDIGTHKAAALARRLEFVNPQVRTRIRRAPVAGQVSGASAEAVLKMIGECDLIFDATANPDVLNLVSAVAVHSNKPAIWAEVFGGGIGGLIARSRPHLDPSPQHMRGVIENWFAERGPPPVRSRRSCETAAAGIPLIADDADVSVIAAHAARFAIDTLLSRDPSLFPHSVYAIGLGVGSVFTQPFETYPIEVGAAQPDVRKGALSQEEAAAEVAKLIQLIEARTHEVASTTNDNRPAQA